MWNPTAGRFGFLVAGFPSRSVLVAREPRPGFESLCQRGGYPKPYELIGFGDIHGPKPYKFTGFGDIHGPKHHKFTGLVTSVPSRPCLFAAPKQKLKGTCGLWVGSPAALVTVICSFLDHFGGQILSTGRAPQWSPTRSLSGWLITRKARCFGVILGVIFG